MTKGLGKGAYLRDIAPADIIVSWLNTEIAQTENGPLINHLVVDSRQVESGDCFVAYPGHHADGRKYIQQAVANGAVGVLAEASEFPQGEHAVPVLLMEQLSKHLPEVAGNFYGSPSSQLDIVAITGTNGKTTVAQLVAGALEQTGKACGVMGTLGNGRFGQLKTSSNTTPDIVAVNRMMAEWVDDGVEAVAMEASSHGLVQGRLEGVDINVGVMTNISRDHLDYHGTMEAYQEAKGLLASWPGLDCFVANLDDPLVVDVANKVKANAKTKVVTFSMRPLEAATVKAERVNFHGRGIELTVSAKGDHDQIQTADITCGLIGEFNASNLLAAVSALMASGVTLTDACSALSKTPQIPGRMELVSPDEVSLKSAPMVVVDFAHTPDALEKALTALRHHCEGELWCVFGCGGDRDSGKRPLMGGIVSQLADNLVITADNPRSENLSVINSDIVAGIDEGRDYQIIDDRTDAIGYALSQCKQGDVVLVAGKGHEGYQEVKGVKHLYSDLEAARKGLSVMSGKSSG